MGVDSILDWPCEAKASLARSHGGVGVVQLVERLKSRSRIDTLLRLAAEQGLPEEQVAITIQREGPSGRETSREVKLPELRAEAATLEPLETHCANCPANVTGQPFSCVHFLQYPISQAAEEWLLNRLQPPESPGGFLLLSAFRDLGYDGAPIQEYRSQGLFESSNPVIKPLNPNRFNRPQIDSNQLLHPLLGVGIELDSSHVMMLLLWLGVIALDGQVPSTREQFATLVNLTPAQRKERTTLELGPVDTQSQAGDFPGLLALLFRAWQLDQPALIDS